MHTKSKAFYMPKNGLIGKVLNIKGLAFFTFLNILIVKENLENFQNLFLKFFEIEKS